MSDKNDVAPYIINPRDYKPELEERVRFFVGQITPLPRNTKKYKRRLPPARFATSYQEELWKMEEIERILNGHDDLVGGMYFYFHYCWIEKIGDNEKKGGKIRPDFRVADHEWFRRWEDAESTPGGGMIGVKRRRVGASWKAAACVVRQMILNSYHTIGMNSKSEKDSKLLFKKVKFIFDNLPSWLKPSIGSSQAMRLEFFREKTDESGNKKRVGHQTTSFCVAPTVSAFEGEMMNTWICDEAGKIANLEQLWSFSEDTMMDEWQRTGTPFIFGTVGEIDKNGVGILELWTNAEHYGLTKFFIGGWMGLFVDEYGNDRIEESVRFIVYEGEKMKKRGNKYYIDFCQKYPLTEEMAFSMSTEGGLGDVAQINEQRQRLIDKPPDVRRGMFRWGIPQDGEEKVVFIPYANGDIYLFEEPQKLKDGYVAGADPAHEIDNPLAKTSDMSLMIRRRMVGLHPPRIALAYTARPKVGTEFFEQTIMALEYFGGIKVLVEKNVRDMLNYFTHMGYQHLLFHEPNIGTSMRPRQPNTLGGRMTTAMKVYMEKLIERDLKDNVFNIEYMPLLKQLPMYGVKNVDAVYAYGWALIMEQELLRPAMRDTGQSSQKVGLNYRYVRRNGKVMREYVNPPQNDDSEQVLYLPGMGVEGGIMSLEQLEKMQGK